MGHSSSFCWFREKENLQYLGVAGISGVVWYFALLVPSMSREFLWSPSNLGQSLKALVMMCVASVLASTLLRRPIVKARGIIRNSLMAVLIPSVGCVLFWFQVSMWGLIDYLWSYAIYGHAPFYSMYTAVKPNFSRLLNQLWFFPLLALYLSFGLLYYIVIPMGFFSQLLLRSVGRN